MYLSSTSGSMSKNIHHRALPDAIPTVFTLIAVSSRDATASMRLLSLKQFNAFVDRLAICSKSFVTGN